MEEYENSPWLQRTANKDKLWLAHNYWRNKAEALEREVARLRPLMALIEEIVDRRLDERVGQD